MKRLLCLLSLLLAVVDEKSGAAEPPAVPAALTNWTQLVTAAKVTAVGYGDGLYLAGTDSGTVLSSADGSTWEFLPHESGIGSINGLVYAQGMWVAVGAGGRVHSSTDGRAWTRQWSGTDTHLRGITYGDGRFVAVGGGSDPRTRTILMSTNAVNWMVRDLSMNQGALWRVAYGQGLFVAVGNSGNLMTSGDTRNWWTITNLTSQQLSGIAYGQGQFIAVGVGGIFSSTNGFRWRTNRLGTVNLFDVAVSPDCFVVTGNNDTRIWSSMNGVDWSPTRIGSSVGQSVVTYGGGRFVAGGERGMIAVSTNGLDWDAHEGGTLPSFEGLAAGNGRMAAVNSGRLIISEDGARWEPVMSLLGQQIYKVHFAGGQFIATTDQQIVATSRDGINWSQGRVNLPSTPEKVVYGKGIYVGVRDHFFASMDGTNWSVTGAPINTPLLGLAFGNDRFVAVRKARVYQSTDGRNWVTNFVTGFELMDVAYGNGVFAAVGFHDVNGPNITAVSSDGINWTTNSLPRAADGARYVSLTFGGGWFVGYGPAGRILVSRDGVNWTAVRTGFNSSWSSVAYDRGRFIGVGYPGVVFESGSFPMLEIGAPGGAGLRLSVGGMPNEIFAIEATGSLTNPVWREVGRVTNSAAETVFEDAMRSEPRRFYRLVAPGD